MQDYLLLQIADYVVAKKEFSSLAYQTAKDCLLDAFACLVMALPFPACQRHLGPIINGSIIPKGTIVPGTNYRLDPIKAAHDISTLIRWLDFNDTWLAKEWGHPSDNLGAILAACDYANKHLNKKYILFDVLQSMIMAYEIQGMLAIDNSFNELGLDHVILVKLASTAVIVYLLGGTRLEIINALSQCFVDGNSLRTYRHAPNVSARKSWAAGDAVARAMQLSLITLKGEEGYKTPISAPKWGFADVYKIKNKFTLNELNCYVMENILFKVSYPAEFHAQTAVECGVILHQQIKNKIDDIEKIIIETQEPAIRIISKKGKLNNPADRDHCLQYMVAVALLEGELTAKHYEDEYAVNNHKLEKLREQMQVIENKIFTKEYYEPNKRAIANSVQIFFKDGKHSERVARQYPVGHKFRRFESKDLLFKKFQNSITNFYQEEQARKIIFQMQSNNIWQHDVDKWLEIWALNFYN